MRRRFSRRAWRPILAAVLVALNALSAEGQEPSAASPTQSDGGSPSSPWLIVPIVSSSPKLGTSIGALGAIVHQFDQDSRVSLFGAMFQYTSTESKIGAAFARTSFGADRHRLVGLIGLGYVRNDYDDYLGTGQPLKTNDDLHAFAGRYLYRVAGNWFAGAQGVAVNYQVLGASAEDDFALETLGIRGFESAAIGIVAMHDSRDNEDMPTAGWYLNVNNLAYREALGGAATFDSYRADLRMFWGHGNGHVFAVRQSNWLTHDAPPVAQAAVVLRGYKIGEYLAPYMSSVEAEERVSLHRRLGATLFAGIAGLYGDRTAASATRTYYPAWGGGLHFILKPTQRLLANLEYAQGIEGNRGLYLKFGYGW